LKRKQNYSAAIEVSEERTGVNGAAIAANGVPAAVKIPGIEVSAAPIAAITSTIEDKPGFTGVNVMKAVTAGAAITANGVLIAVMTTAMFAAMLGAISTKPADMRLGGTRPVGLTGVTTVASAMSAGTIAVTTATTEASVAVIIVATVGVTIAAITAATVMVIAVAGTMPAVTTTEAGTAAGAMTGAITGGVTAAATGIITTGAAIIRPIGTIITGAGTSEFI